jgi:hypothetical protein
MATKMSRDSSKQSREPRRKSPRPMCVFPEGKQALTEHNKHYPTLVVGYFYSMEWSNRRIALAVSR